MYRWTRFSNGFACNCDILAEIFGETLSNIRNNSWTFCKEKQGLSSKLLPSEEGISTAIFNFKFKAIYLGII